MAKKLNSNHLKLIAIIAMTIDHVTDLFYPGFPVSPVPLVLHFIGKLTAPIMWFFVCEGYFYTKDVIGSRGCWWWLRSPGPNNSSSSSVYACGDSGAGYGSLMSDDYLAVRPAMYIEY